MPTISEVMQTAVQRHQAGQIVEAEAIYRQVLESDPNQADAVHLLGVCLHQSGRRPEAIDYFRRAIALSPRVASFHNSLGNTLKAQGQLDQALETYRRAIELQPDYVDAYVHAGNTLRALEKPAEAVAAYQQALARQPTHTDAMNNLGNVLADLRRNDEAIVLYRRALALKPNFFEAYNNLGTSLKALGKFDESLSAMQHCLELNPQFAPMHYNFGNTYYDLGRHKEAIAYYSRAVELDPQYVNAHFNRANTWLLTGQWEQGLPAYEWRWREKGVSPRQLPQPEWDGSSLAGKRIFLHAEQGLGDAIQFLRFAPYLKRQGAHVIVECQRPMVQLFRSCPDIDQLLSRGDAIPPFDVHAAFMSIPRILRTTVQTVPADVPFLHASPDLVERWKVRLAERQAFRIGVAWQGNRDCTYDRIRSFPLRYFAPLAQVPGVQLYSLQKGDGAEQVQQLGNEFSIIDFTDEMDQRVGPFMDTAAVMKNLDLVISCDSVTAHLAGALNVPVWLPLPFVPYWYWQLERSDTPWYPSMRLFRQPERGNWDVVFQSMADVLADRLMPQSPQGSLALGKALQSQNRHAEAINACRQYLRTTPTSAEAYYLLGTSHERLNELDESVKCYQRAVELEPQIAALHYNLGTLLDQLERKQEALVSYRRAIAIRPDYPEAHNNLARVLCDLNEPEAAVAAARRAVELLPDRVEPHTNLVSALRKLRRLNEAIICCQRAAALYPTNALLQLQLGNLHREDNKFVAAMACYRRALELKSDYADAHYNLGIAYDDVSDPAAAVASYQRALEIRPDYVDAMVNLGRAYVELRELEKAEAVFQNALKHDATNSKARCNLGCVWLQQGRWSEGWTAFESRLEQLSIQPRTFAQPLWNGENLSGRTILLYGEEGEGLGDWIQYLRYGVNLQRLGARVVVECKRPLLNLFSRSAGVDQWVAEGSLLPPFDVRVPLLSLPRTLGVTVESSPACSPYVFAAPDLVEKWQQRLSSLEGFKVGIQWQGNTAYRHGKNRSIPLKRFAPLAGVPGVRLICLQKGGGIEQLASLRDELSIHSLGDDLDVSSGPFMDTAAVMRNLDLVVTSDTSTAHLAGALGVPTWVALRFAADWRWLNDRSDTVWYPTLRLFRQPEPENWEFVFEQIRQALCERLRPN